MRLAGGLGRLTYCQNIHPAESWAEARAALLGPTRAVKAALSPDAPFTVGLRLSAQAVRDLAAPPAQAALIRLLAEEGYEAATVNGFPYGPFHGAPVKQAVYRPDWRDPARLDYTCALAALMARIAPQGETATLSTVPGGFAADCAGDEAAVADGLLQAAAHCARLAQETGATVALAVEPEPRCLMQTTAGAIDFFARWLFDARAVRRMADLAGLSTTAAAAALPRHLGLCFDVCHAAVEFEDIPASLAALRAAGVPAHKMQLSAALRVARADAQARAALSAFAEPVYLHQVTARRGDGALLRFDDLPGALAAAEGATPGSPDGAEWRVHFHVPVFTDVAGPFSTTQDALAAALAIHRAQPVTPHLEVETYTWGVLPEALRGGPVEAAVTREMRWVLARLAP